MSFEPQQSTELLPQSVSGSRSPLADMISDTAFPIIPTDLSPATPGIAIDDDFTSNVEDPLPDAHMVHTFSTTVGEFLTTTNLSVDCEVTMVTSEDCTSALAGLERGCKIVVINGEQVLTQADVRQLLSRFVGEDETIEVGFKAGASLQRAARISHQSMDSAAVPDVLEQQVHEIESAVNRVKQGCCIIIRAPLRSFPMSVIHECAQNMGGTLHHLDAAAPLSRRPRRDVMRSNVEAALKFGEWVVMENATKSMSVLAVLLEAKETLSREGMLHKDSRIFIITEPHPHFPIKLLEGAVSLTFQPGESDAGATLDDQVSLKDSISRIKQMRGVDSRENSIAELPKSRRKVRMGSITEVDPEYESVEYKASQSVLIPVELAPNPGGQPIPREVRPPSQGLEGERFTSICPAGKRHLVIGSSGGNVYAMGLDGLQQLAFHAHGGCVWSIDSCGKDVLATASEDASVNLWTHDTSCERPGFGGRVLSRFSNDVLAVRFVEKDNPFAVCAGGLNGSLVFVNANTNSRSVLPTVSTILALYRVEESSVNGKIAMGGGSGLVTVWDGEVSVALETFFHHKQKACAVHSQGNLLFSGSFDATTAMSDMRSRQLVHRWADFPGVVSAIDVDENVLATCSGTELLVYDLRKPHALLYRRAEAWTGICNGVQLDHSEGVRIAVVATSDGAVKFYGVEESCCDQPSFDKLVPA